MRRYQQAMAALKRDPADKKSIFTLQRLSLSRKMYKLWFYNKQHVTAHDLARWNYELLQVIGALHCKDVVHGRISPKNIYFLDDDEIVLADPSAGDWIDESWSDKCRSVEAWHNKSDESSDIYSIGISLYWA